MKNGEPLVICGLGVTALTVFLTTGSATAAILCTMICGISLMLGFNYRQWKNDGMRRFAMYIPMIWVIILAIGMVITMIWGWNVLDILDAPMLLAILIGLIAGDGLTDYCRDLSE